MDDQRLEQNALHTPHTISETTLEEILITRELERRAPRPPDYAAENRALVALAESMAENPQHLPQQLTDLAVELCRAGSAGISLLQQDVDGEFFHWIALSGTFATHIGDRTPRHMSHCGITIDRNAPQLFFHPSRLFTYFDEVEAPIIESLVLPIELNGKAAGAIWIVGHDANQQFDAEDVRLMTSLARFSGAALQVSLTLEIAKAANRTLQDRIHERKQAEEALLKSEAALRELNTTLERRVQERTEELERSNRELDQFAYVASHDLKAPLRAINQLATWIAQDTDGLLPATAQEYLVKLQGRIHRLETLLDDLLAYSRAGRQRHLPELIDTAELVNSIVELLSPSDNFTVQVADAMPVIMTERIPLETVFRNLIGNAIKHHHAPEDGFVEISGQDRGEFVEFSVKDNGPGIEDRFHRRIFEMFQTLRPRDQIEGSGIGLSVVKKILESRGGTIHIESSPGDGSTFRFTWQKATAPEEDTD
jgi:signal transduction histidine kinase